jgi:hypothetical protein
MADRVKAICDKLKKKAKDADSKEFLDALKELEGKVKQCMSELGLGE